jgi:hypothetical protein
MNNEEIESIANHMIEVFGRNVPSPIHYPKMFDYYLKLYIYYYRKDLVL